MLFSSVFVKPWIGRPGREGVARASAVLPKLAALLVASVSRLATASEAEPIPVRLHEELPASCPREPSTLERLQARLPRVREAGEGERAVDIEVRVDAVGSSNHGTITLVSGGERAQREASSTSCEKVLVALAVMAAIGLDGGEVKVAETPKAAAPDEAKGEGASEPQGAPAPTRPRRRRSKVSPKPASDPAPRFGFALGSGIQGSVNRGIVTIPGVFAQIEFPLRLAPILRVGFGRSFRNDSASARGTVGAQWDVATADACADVATVGRFRVGPCLNVEAGALKAIVIEPLPARIRWAAWSSAGGSARITWKPLSAWSLELLGGVKVPLVRNQLLFEPAILVYQAPAVVPFVGLAAVAHLP